MTVPRHGPTVIGSRRHIRTRETGVTAVVEPPRTLDVARATSVGVTVIVDITCGETEPIVPRQRVPYNVRFLCLVLIHFNILVFNLCTSTYF